MREEAIWATPFKEPRRRREGAAEVITNILQAWWRFGRQREREGSGQSGKGVNCWNRRKLGSAGEDFAYITHVRTVLCRMT